MEHRFTAGLQAREDAVPFPGAGGDQLNLRIDAEGGPCPMAVVEAVSRDRVWVQAHSHPWDEFTYVVEGEIEFSVGEHEGPAGAGAVVTLPRGMPHTLRVPGERPGTSW